MTSVERLAEQDKFKQTDICMLLIYEVIEILLLVAEISVDLSNIVVSYPPICFFSLAQSSTSVKRKTCLSFLAPSTSSTMKLSLRSWRLCGNMTRF